MNEKNLIVCDRDKRYARSLGENISERKEFALRVFVCTGSQKVIRFGEEEKLDILLVDETFPREERRKMQAEQKFVLTKDACEELDEGETGILKYQSVDGILGCVFQTYYEKTKDNILKKVKKPRQRVLAVYSPIHRIGKTSFALALGKELAKREKTLYLNLETYSDIGGRFVRAEGKNLGDLLYYMHQENQDMGMRLASLVCRQGELDYIPPMLSSQDLRGVSVREWKQLLEEILQNSHYETIVLDLSDGIQDLFSILAVCDEIYMPILEDVISKQKVAMYEKEIQEQHLTEILKQTHQFVAEEDMEVCAARWGKEEE